MTPRARADVALLSARGDRRLRESPGGRAPRAVPAALPSLAGRAPYQELFDGASVRRLRVDGAGNVELPPRPFGEQPPGERGVRIGKDHRHAAPGESRECALQPLVLGLAEFVL